MPGLEFEPALVFLARTVLGQQTREVAVMDGEDDHAALWRVERLIWRVGNIRRSSVSVSATTWAYRASRKMRSRCVRASFEMCPSPKYKPSSSE